MDIARAYRPSDRIVLSTRLDPPRRTVLSCELCSYIGKITGIPRIVLKKEIDAVRLNFSVATKMSWAAGRKTTRPEDRAYSLMRLSGKEGMIS